MPKAFPHLAAALLGASSFAQLSVSSSSVLTSGAYAVQISASSESSRKKRRGITPDGPEGAANVLDVLPTDAVDNVLGALGTGEGGLQLNILNSATKQKVEEMQRQGSVGVQPEVLWVGKLLAAMRDGKRPNLNWNSLPAWATPEVAKVAIEQQLIPTAQWNALTGEAVVWTPTDHLIPWWNSLPAEVRADKDVVLTAIKANLVGFGGFLASEQWWNSLPDELRAMPDVVAAAIEWQLIRTPEQWNSLPAVVRADKQVVLGALQSDKRFIWTAEYIWNSLPAKVKADEDVALRYFFFEAFAANPPDIDEAANEQGETVTLA